MRLALIALAIGTGLVAVSSPCDRETRRAGAVLLALAVPFVGLGPILGESVGRMLIGCGWAALGGGLVTAGSAGASASADIAGVPGAPGFSRSRMDPAALRLPALTMAACGPALAWLPLLRPIQDAYWFHPLVFVTVTSAAVAFSAAGPFLMGRARAARRARHPKPRPVVLSMGIATGLLGCLAGSMAVLLAVGLSGTGYWGEAPFSYSGDYLFMGIQLLALAAAPLPLAAGGFLIGLGMRPTPDRDGSSHPGRPPDTIGQESSRGVARG